TCRSQADSGLHPDPKIAAVVRRPAEHHLTIGDDRWACRVDASISGGDPDECRIDGVPRFSLGSTLAPARLRTRRKGRPQCVMEASANSYDSVITRLVPPHAGCLPHAASA